MLVYNRAEVDQLSCYGTADNVAHLTFHFCFCFLFTCLFVPIVLHSLVLLLLLESAVFLVMLITSPGTVYYWKFEGTCEIPVWLEVVRHNEAHSPSFVTWVLLFMPSLIKKKLFFVLGTKGSWDKWESGTNNELHNFRRVTEITGKQVLLLMSAVNNCSLQFFFEAGLVHWF